MRLSNEELMLLNRFSYTVLTLRDKYSDFDKIEDPITLAFADYITYGEDFRYTKAIYRKREIPFDKDKIIALICTGTDSQNRSLAIDKELAYACKINILLDERKIKSTLFNSIKYQITRYNDDYLKASLAYFGYESANPIFHYCDPDEDAERMKHEFYGIDLYPGLFDDLPE